MRAPSSSSSRGSQPPARRLHGASTSAKVSNVTSASSSSSTPFPLTNRSSDYTFTNPTLIPVEDVDTMALFQPNTSTHLTPHPSSHAMDDLQKLVNVNFSQHDATSSLATNHDQYSNVCATDFLSYFPTLQAQPPPEVAAPDIVMGSSLAALSDRLMWDWNAISEAGIGFTSLFK